MSVTDSIVSIGTFLNRRRECLMSWDVECRSVGNDVRKLLLGASLQRADLLKAIQADLARK